MENGRWIILIVGYIPLWEDSQWYVRKPTPELAEDCQLCWWKCEKRIILLICSYHCERIHRSISWNLRQNWQRIASSVGGNVRKRITLLICSYHCEKIHRNISWNPRQNWQRIASSVGGNVRKRITLLICLYHCEKIHRNISWNPRQNWQRIASSVGGNVRKRNILLIVHTTVRGFTGAYYETYVRTGKGLPVLTEKQNYTTVCSYHCERIHRSISWNLCQNWQRTASFDEGRWVKKNYTTDYVNTTVRGFTMVYI
jgi:hypothetical protein